VIEFTNSRLQQIAKTSLGGRGRHGASFYEFGLEFMGVAHWQRVCKSGCAAKRDVIIAAYSGPSRSSQGNTSTILEAGMITHICSYTHPMSKRITRSVAESMKPRYRGWRSRYDRQYANRTAYAYVLGPRNTILAAMRVVFKKSKTKRGNLPLENGLPATSSLGETGRAAEISGIVCKDHRALFALVAGVTQWLINIGTKSVFAIINPEDPKTTKLLVQDLGFDKLDGKVVSFPGFVHKATGNAVRWQVLRYTSDKLRNLSRALQAQGHTAKPIIHVDFFATITSRSRRRRSSSQVRSIPIESAP
jgi:hypothetical protein